MDKHNLLIGVGIFASGVALGWAVKPEPAAKAATTEVSRPDSASPSKPLANAAPQAGELPPGKRAHREPAAKNPAELPVMADEIQTARIQEEMSKLMTSRQRARLEKYLRRITESVSLTETQKETMTAWLDGQLKALGQLDFSDPEAISKMSDLAEALSDRAMDEKLAAVLTEDQKAPFDQFRAKEHQNRVDSTALRSLSQLQGVVDFEEGQRDEVYKVLSAAAEEKVLREQANPDPSIIFNEGMGFEMDPYDLGLQEAMRETMEGGPNAMTSGNPQEAAQAMRELIGKRIEEKVDRLRPVLNEKQLEQYRSELETKGLGVFGTAIMGMEGEAPAANSLNTLVPGQ
jgi:hypothetical protein